MSKIIKMIQKDATRRISAKEEVAAEVLTKSKWPNFIITDTHLVFQVPLKGTSDNLVQSMYASLLEMKRQHRAKHRKAKKG